MHHEKCITSCGDDLRACCAHDSCLPMSATLCRVALCPSPTLCYFFPAQTELPTELRPVGIPLFSFYQHLSLLAGPCCL